MGREGERGRREIGGRGGKGEREGERGKGGTVRGEMGQGERWGVRGRERESGKERRGLRETQRQKVEGDRKRDRIGDAGGGGKE